MAPSPEPATRSSAACVLSCPLGAPPRVRCDADAAPVARVRVTASFVFFLWPAACFHRNAVESVTAAAYLSFFRRVDDFSPACAPCLDHGAATRRPASDGAQHRRRGADSRPGPQAERCIPSRPTIDRAGAGNAMPCPSAFVTTYFFLCFLTRAAAAANTFRLLTCASWPGLDVRPHSTSAAGIHRTAPAYDDRTR